MPDMLTHVLAAYFLFSVIAWRVDRISDAYIPIAMVGALIPDLAKITWFIAPSVMESLPIPIALVAIHRLGGVVVLAGLGALLFERGKKMPVFAVMTTGGIFHLFLDVFNTWATGRAPPYLYPITWWQPPSGNLYVSAEFWPAVLSVLAAVSIWTLKRRAESTQIV